MGEKVEGLLFGLNGNPPLLVRLVMDGGGPPPKEICGTTPTTA
jgi:hypothetical protein